MWENLLNTENQLPEKLIGAFAGEDVIPTERKLLEQLESAGLGEIEITDIADSKLTGFQAIAFADGSGNKGISYAGSDFDSDMGKDWLATDLGEYIFNDSLQAYEARKFFEDNKGENGNNYLYGHSLGGNLTAHAYVRNYDEIAEAFVINGTPINTSKLSEEQIEALNNSKYNCYVVGGDLVSQLKNYDAYANNVKYIKNNNEKSALVYSHTVQAATLDEAGNFILEDSKEIAYKDNPWVLNSVIDLSQHIRTKMNERDKIVEETVKDFIDDSKVDIKEVFRKGKEHFDSTIQGFEEIATDTIQAAKESDTEKKQEIKEYIIDNIQGIQENDTDITQEADKIDVDIIKNSESNKNKGFSIKDRFNKVINSIKDTYNKVKATISKIVSPKEKGEVKLLGSGENREQSSNSVINTSHKSNDFLEAMRIGNWISDTYTREQAEHAQRISDNPKELINTMENEQNNSNRAEKDDKPSEVIL